MTRPRLFTPFDWIMAVGTIILIALIIWFCFILGARPAASAAGTALSIGSPANNAELPAGSFTLSGGGTPGEVLEVFQDDFSLGSAAVGPDGTWSLRVPSVGQGGGSYTYRVASTSTGGREAATRVNFAAVTAASGAVCERDYFLSVADGQALSQPFRFGGDGRGQGYTVTVKRGERVIGSRPMRLDATCGWGYDSRPGPGTVTYEVREGLPPTVDLSAAPLSTVTITVR